MIRQNFLNKLKAEKKLELVEPSENIFLISKINNSDTDIFRKKFSSL